MDVSLLKMGAKRFSPTDPGLEETMSKSKRLRLRELRGLYQLLGECCELGADPVAWRQHMTAQLPALLRCQMSMCHEFKVVGRPFQDPFWLIPLHSADFGWATASDRKPLEEHMGTGRPEDGPHVTPDLLGRNIKTVHWTGKLGRKSWHNSMFFNEFVKRTHLDDGIFLHHQTGSGQMRWLFVNRALGDRPFSDRDRRLMTLLNLELTRLLGMKLARIGEPTVADLPPRQRDVLICLMEGDSEKQVALKLNISQHTVHDYVKRLHERFGVSSRGELLARCRAFWPALKVNSDTSPSAN